MFHAVYYYNLLNRKGKKVFLKIRNPKNAWFIQDCIAFHWEHGPHSAMGTSGHRTGHLGVWHIQDALMAAADDSQA